MIVKQYTLNRKTYKDVKKMDHQFIRQGIILGFLKFGVAFKKEGSSQYDYYISPMKFWEETGFVYAGEEC